MAVGFVNQCNELFDTRRFVETSSMDHNLLIVNKVERRLTDDPGTMGRVVSNVMMRAVKFDDTEIGLSL